MGLKLLYKNMMGYIALAEKVQKEKACVLQAYLHPELAIKTISPSSVTNVIHNLKNL